MSQEPTCSPSGDSQNSATTRGSKRRKGRPPQIVIPDKDLPSGDGKITDSNELQHAIYIELTKITSSLNAAAPKSPATETSSSFLTRSGGFWASSRHVTVRDSSDNRAKLEAAEYDALGQQFTTLVIISTFTANLIIGFLTLAYNILRSQTDFPKIKFEVGMFFALGGMAIHSGVIIVAGRSAALALKYAKRLPAQAYLKKRERGRENETDGSESESGAEDYSPNSGAEGTFLHLGKGKEPEYPDLQISHLDEPSTSGTNHHIPSKIPLNEPRSPFAQLPFLQQPSRPKPKCTLSLLSPALGEVPQDQLRSQDFHVFLKVCESLQLLGTAIFFLGVMIFIFVMFFHRAFPIMLLLGCLIGSCSISWKIGFWKVSATHQLLTTARDKARTKVRILREMLRGPSIRPGDVVGDSVRGNGSAADLKPSLKKERRLSARLFKFGVHWQDTTDLEKGGNEKTR
ncbi:hypothetical protein AX15_006573 [Amanita polypyramis BW_CC]|nr:hypothetical protein AX15_006573 [Amanita polypyramis BW_CC]